MAVLSIAEAERQAYEDKLWAARGRAIQGYAGLEQKLCGMLAYCASVPFDVAAIIFFKITAARARNAIIEKLIRRKFGSTYNLFWNSLFTRLKRHVDEQRNKIVHWSALVTVASDKDGAMTVDVCLKPASYWENPVGDFDRLNAADMVEFEAECDFWANAIHMFALSTSKTELAPDFPRDAWLAIFQQPLAYPPPDTHPQAQMLSTLRSPPPPSPESDPPAPSPA